jgi:hypothetical protein
MAIEVRDPNPLPETNRYQSIARYFDTDRSEEFTGFFDKYITIPDHDNDTWIELTDREKLRFDTLSFQYYGTPYLFWFIMKANDIINPFCFESRFVRIPSIQTFINLLF